MKKLATLVLVLVMLVTLAACGGKPAPTAAGGTDQPTAPLADPPATASPAAEPSAPEQGGKLTVWCWDPAFNLYAMQTAGELYKKDHPDFELEVLEVPWEDIQTRITTAATSGNYDTMPDILLCQNNAYQKNVINFPDLFMDLTGSGIAFNQFGESAVAYSVIDGKNYGVPFDNGTAINALRTDVLEQAGYTVADFKDITWEAYITKGADVLAKTGKPLMSMASDSMDLIMMMLQSAGSSLFNADGTPNIANNDILRKGIDIQKRLIEGGILLQVNNWDEYIASFIDNKVAGTINGCWILGSIQTAEDQSGKWAITNLPRLDVDGGTNYSANGGSSWGVTTNSKNPDLAMDFLSKTFAGSAELYDTILPASGALANYLPAGDSTVYAQPQAFFGDQAIYADIVEFSSNVPSNQTGAYYYEARDAVNVALVNILAGGDVDQELKAAEDTLLFNMGG